MHSIIIILGCRHARTQPWPIIESARGKHHDGLPRDTTTDRKHALPVDSSTIAAACVMEAAAKIRL